MEEGDLNTCCLGPGLRGFVCFSWNKRELRWGSPNRCPHFILLSLCEEVLGAHGVKLTNSRQNIFLPRLTATTN